jgi:hypothetical protein
MSDFLTIILSHIGSLAHTINTMRRLRFVDESAISVYEKDALLCKN